MKSKDIANSKLGLLGAALGTLALLIAMISFFEGPFTVVEPLPEPTLKEKLVETGSSIIAGFKAPTSSTDAERVSTREPVFISIGFCL